MAKQTKPAWYGLAAVAIGTGIFFLATTNGRLFKKSAAGLKALLSSPPAVPDATSVPDAAPAPSSPSFKGRTPSPENGHVRDVIASNPPPPETGGNLTPQGDVHEPQS